MHVELEALRTMMFITDEMTIHDEYELFSFEDSRYT